MPRPVRPKRSSAKSSSFTTTAATWLTVVLSLITLNLTLLGYGYDLAYLDALGLHPEDLQRTPLDFLLRSWRPIITLVERLGSFWSLETQQRLWEPLLWKQQQYIPLLTLPIFTALLACIAYHKDAKIIQNVARRCQYIIHRRMFWVRRCKQRIAAMRATFLQELKHPKLTRKWGYLGSALSLAYLAIAALMIAAIWIFVALGIFLVANVPSLGMTAGTTRAKNEVLTPVGCAKHTNPAEIPKDQLANCVRIIRDEKEVASGYLIDYGAGRVFIFQPCVNRQVSFPLATSVVETIDELEYSSREKDCIGYKKYRNSKLTGKP